MYRVSGYLKKHKLYATSTTGQMIEDVANLKIHKLLAGHFGGMQQMGSKISNNEIDLLIFYRTRQIRREHQIFIMF